MFRGSAGRATLPFLSMLINDLGRAVANPRGVAAMMKNIVAGFTLAALIFMGLLAYAQKHHECRNGYLVVKAFKHGHIIKTHTPCGSVDTSM